MKEPMDGSLFFRLLRASMIQWKHEGKKGVWIKLPIELANLIEVAIKVLVVQEKNGRFHGTGIWKIPTRVVDGGEDICAAAVREVKKETGVVENVFKSKSRQHVIRYGGGVKLKDVRGSCSSRVELQTQLSNAKKENQVLSNRVETVEAENQALIKRIGNMEEEIETLKALMLYYINDTHFTSDATQKSPGT